MALKSHDLHNDESGELIQRIEEKETLLSQNVDEMMESIKKVVDLAKQKLERQKVGVLMKKGSEDEGLMRLE